MSRAFVTATLALFVWGRFALAGPPAKAPAVATVRVFFGTDREPGDANDSADDFRSEPDGEERTSAGYCDVEVNTKDRTSTLKSVIQTGVASVVQRLSSGLSARRPARSLFYVHGYKNTFRKCMEDAARVADALEIDGPVVAWSWPSSGKVQGYWSDEDEMVWTQPHLVAFLGQVLPVLARSTVIGMAHSMGSRVLALALAQLARDPGRAAQTRLMDTLVFVAADISPPLARQCSHAIKSRVTRVVNYVSRRDLVLRISGWIHRQSRGANATAGISSIETVDVSRVIRFDPYDIHGYFRRNSAVLADVLAATRGMDAARRGLEKPKNETYWILR